jgi:hypothetical protein
MAEVDIEAGFGEAFALAGHPDEEIGAEVAIAEALFEGISEDIELVVVVEDDGDLGDGLAAGAGELLEDFRHPSTIREGGGEGAVNAGECGGGEGLDGIGQDGASLGDEVGELQAAERGGGAEVFDELVTGEEELNAFLELEFVALADGVGDVLEDGTSSVLASSKRSRSFWMLARAASLPLRSRTARKLFTMTVPGFSV